MPKKPPAPAIRLRGVRHNNLKNFDLDILLGKFTVITGLSGSGKSSLAFDTLFAEGQRRYIETFSPYARQFFDRMDKPQVDSIEGIPPAIAIEQRNAVKTTRSTVGTMTEICDHSRLLWHHLAKLYCPSCGEAVRKDSPQQIWETLSDKDGSGNRNVIITFDLPLAEKVSLEESLDLIGKQGYQRLYAAADRGSAKSKKAKRVANAYELNDRATPMSGYGSEASQPVMRLEEASERYQGAKPERLTVVQDRVKLTVKNRARFIEACEQAYHFGKGRLTLRFDDGIARQFSKSYHCAACDRDFREPSPALFSFNNPVGACSACKGFGRIITIDYDLAIPDHSLTLEQGAIKPWQSGHGVQSQNDMMVFIKQAGVPLDVPFNKLTKAQRSWVVDGEPGYGADESRKWPNAWYGLKGYFRWLESKAYKMHMRVLLSRYRSYVKCPDCDGLRYKPEALQYRLTAGGKRSEKTSEIGSDKRGLTVADFYQLTVRDALDFVEALAKEHAPKKTDPLSLVLGEARSRLGFLSEVGLDYLTIDRPTRSLSGGETERVNLTTCLGTRLVNTLFVLDEPSVGLHPRDTSRLVSILQRLRDAGNTVVIVEHEAGLIRAADRVVDLGPKQGEQGGEIVFDGTFAALNRDKRSLTGQYMSGRTEIPVPERRDVVAGKDGKKAVKFLTLSNASLHNLRNVTVEIPLGRLVCISGVSGSGKTTLMRELLLPALTKKLGSDGADESGSQSFDDDNLHANAAKRVKLTGWKQLGRVVLVDQSSLGKTPRSNPAVYIGAFDSIRDLFALSPLAQQRGLKAGAFSFNSAQGQCELCRGTGFEKIEMQFLSDIFIKCPECDGRRYRPHIEEITLDGVANGEEQKWSVADLLEATVNDVVEFLGGFEGSRQAAKAIKSLEYLQRVGLGYLRLGQPINTLSGGECQRLKLVRHLSEFAKAEKNAPKPTLFLFDEPTTGLHFDDVRVLLEVFQELVDAGHSVVVIEHNLDVLKCSDWLIDLGPDAGDAGGEVVAAGSPETVAACDASHTGRELAAMGLK